MFSIWQQLLRNKWKNIFASFQIETWGTVWNGFVLQNVCLCLWTFVLGSKFYPLDRNLRVMSDVKISMSSHNIPSTNDNMKFVHAHMEYQCCMLNSIMNTACEIRLYIMIENNFWRWHNISFKPKKTGS